MTAHKLFIVVFLYSNQAQMCHCVPCKFMLTEDEDFPTDLGHDLALVFWPAVLQHVLYDVVTVLILQEAVAV